SARWSRNTFARETRPVHLLPVARAVRGRGYLADQRSRLVLSAAPAAARDPHGPAGAGVRARPPDAAAATDGRGARTLDVRRQQARALDRGGGWRPNPQARQDEGKRPPPRAPGRHAARATGGQLHRYGGVARWAPSTDRRPFPRRGGPVRHL